MKNSIKYILYSIALLAVAFAFIPELCHGNIHESIYNGVTTASTISLSAVVAPLYYDRVNGKPVYSPSQVAAASGNADAAPGVSGACVCDQVKPYQVPEFITLTAVSTGIGSLAKITPFDDVAEAVQGTLGTIFFGIQELNFGAGTIAKQDGTFIFGADVIREITATRMLVSDYVTMDGTDVAATSSKDLNYIRGYISGNDNMLLKFILVPTNQTAVTVLRWDAQPVLGSPLMWKSNEGFQYKFNLAAPNAIAIHFHIVGFNYYGN